MRPAWTGTRIREAEGPALERGRGPALMAVAAHGLAMRCRELLRRRRGRIAGARVVLLAGTGGNGGDGLWAAADLRRAGATVTVVATGERLHEQGARALREAGGRFLGPGLEGRLEQVLELMLGADLVLDAMLGTGATGGLRGAPAQLAETFERRRPAPDVGPAVVAVDLPSGLDADTGAVPGTVLSAQRTVSFGGAKAPHVLGPADRRCGEIEVVEIGVEHELAAPIALGLEDGDIDALWPRPTAEDHKYTRGVVGIVAGSEDYPGAALLTVRAAQAAGAGMVRYLGDETTRRLVNLTSPEAVVGDGSPSEAHVQSWIAGPGAVDDTQRRRTAIVLDEALERRIPAVLDAGALELVGRTLAERRLRPWLVLTPHAGELAELLSWCEAWGLLPEGTGAPEREQIEAQPGRWACIAARATGATVLLKGATTVIAAPEGDAPGGADDEGSPASPNPLIASSGGSPWLATAGSGDTLSGVLGTLLGHDAGRPDRLEHSVGPWLRACALPEHLVAPTRERLLGSGRWALLAGLACAVQARASRSGGQGPQPALPEDIRRALSAPGDVRELS